MKNVIICGLGAVGMTYASKLGGKSRGKCNLKILVNEERLERYSKNKPVLNGVEQDFNYILPDDNFDADLIIIATKASGLDSAVKMIKNFVSSKTIILSLLNGISSEEVIRSAYPEAKVLKSYFIGHSAVRVGNSVKQDGVGEIVMERDDGLIKFFNDAGVGYAVPDDIDYSMWLKFTMNIFSNQTSAVLNMTFGEMKYNKAFIDFAKKIIAEVRSVAENLEKDALDALSRMCDEGKTSMHQDILAGRKTEVDIFAGEMIKLGRELGVPVPYNQVLYDMVKIKEAANE